MKEDRAYLGGIRKFPYECSLKCDRDPNIWGLEGRDIRPRCSPGEPGYNPILDRAEYDWYDYKRDLIAEDEYCKLDVRLYSSNTNAYFDEEERRRVEFRKEHPRMAEIEDLIETDLRDYDPSECQRYETFLEKAIEKAEFPEWNHWSTEDIIAYLRLPLSVGLYYADGDHWGRSDEELLSRMREKVSDVIQETTALDKVYSMLERIVEDYPQWIDLRLKQGLFEPEKGRAHALEWASLNYLDSLGYDYSRISMIGLTGYIQGDIEWLEESYTNSQNEPVLNTRPAILRKNVISTTPESMLMTSGHEIISDAIWNQTPTFLKTPGLWERKVYRPTDRDKGTGIPTVWRTKKKEGLDPWDLTICNTIFGLMAEKFPEELYQESRKLSNDRSYNTFIQTLLKQCLGVKKDRGADQIRDFEKTLLDLRECTLMSGFTESDTQDADLVEIARHKPLLEWEYATVKTENGTISNEIVISFTSFPYLGYRDFLENHRFRIGSELRFTEDLQRSHVKERTRAKADKLNLWDKSEEICIRGNRHNAVMKDMIISIIRTGTLEMLDNNKPNRDGWIEIDLIKVIKRAWGTEKPNRNKKNDCRKHILKFLIHLMEKDLIIDFEDLGNPNKGYTGFRVKINPKYVPPKSVQTTLLV